jgi:hypothetical protein
MVSNADLAHDTGIGAFTWAFSPDLRRCGVVV